MHLPENIGQWLRTLGVLSDADLTMGGASASTRRRGFDLSPHSADAIIGGRAVAQALLAVAAAGGAAAALIPPAEREALRQAAVPLRGGGGRRSEPAERLYVWNAVAPALGRLLPGGAGLPADDKALLVAGDEVPPPWVYTGVSARAALHGRLFAGCFTRAFRACCSALTRL